MLKETYITVSLALACAFTIPSSVSAGLPLRAEEIILHMVGLGYSTEVVDGLLICQHDHRTNSVITELEDGIVVMTLKGATKFGETHRADLLELANSLNESSVCFGAYIGADNHLILEAWYPGDYDSTRFGVFIDQWDNDVKSAYSTYQREVQQLLE